MESNLKRHMVASVKAAGGYARRLEDQYGVGIFDLILIPKGLPVFFTEVKIIRGDVFGPSDRQMVEMMQLEQASDGNRYFYPTIIGWRAQVYYFHKAVPSVNRKDCFSITSGPKMSFNDQLVQYYHSIRGDK